MIKAHPVAGNRAVGEAFLGDLTPYIWRKHLDFAAIHDIHSIKRQIDAHRGGSAVKVLGHNVKLGRGGIREIEFFAQTQQLIFGGRNPALRGRGDLRDPARARRRGPRRAQRRRRADRGLRLPAQGRAPPADGRRPPDPQPAQRRGRRGGHRHLPGLSRFAVLPEGPARSPALRRGPLRPPVRGGAEPRRPGRQPGLHRHRRRSGHLGDLADAGLPRSVGGSGHRAALAPRPLPLDRHRPRPRAADRADAGPAEGAGLDRRARPGAAELRPLPRQPAGRHPALLAVQVQPCAARAGRRDHGQRARACRAPGAPHHPARFGAVARLLPAAAAGRGDGAPTSPISWRASSTSRTSSTWRDAGPTTGASRSACSSSRRSCAPPRRAPPIPTSPPPPSRRFATASSRASPSNTAAFAASGSPCSAWASSAAARCRPPPTST